MNSTEKRRAIALVKERAKSAANGVCDSVPELEVPKAIQAKADKVRALVAEIKDAGFTLQTYGKYSVAFDHDNPTAVARRERIEAERSRIATAAERIELDIWSGRIEDFAEAEAHANALVEGGK